MPLPRLSVGESDAQIVVFGESGVGKTCFTDMFLEGKTFILHDAVAAERRSRSFSVGDQNWKIWLMDLNSSVLRDSDPNLSTDFFESCLARADGIVLLYDITSRQSFDDVTDEAYMYAWLCRCAEGAKGEKYLTGRQRFGCVLVGNKADLVKAEPERRQVSKEMAEQWAESQGFRHFEVTSQSTNEVEDTVAAVIKSVKKSRRQDAEDIEEGKRMDAAAQKEQKKQDKSTLRKRITLAFRKSKPAP